VQAVAAACATQRALERRALPERPHASPVVTAIVVAVTAAAFALVAFGLVEFAWLSRWAGHNVGLAGTLAFAGMLTFMLGQVPLAAVMGLTGIFGSALFTGFTPAVSAFATEATTFLTNSQIATLPLFLMMGSFVAVSGMSDDMYRLGHVLLSRYRGGLALAPIGGCARVGGLAGPPLPAAAPPRPRAGPDTRPRGSFPARPPRPAAAG